MRKRKAITVITALVGAGVVGWHWRQHIQSQSSNTPQKEVSTPPSNGVAVVYVQRSSVADPCPELLSLLSSDHLDEASRARRAIQHIDDCTSCQGVSSSNPEGDAWVGREFAYASLPSPVARLLRRLKILPD